MNTDLEQDRLAGLDDGDDAQRIACTHKKTGNPCDAVALERIERALDRIRSGDYGYCTLCGDPLSLGMLETDPTAESCRRCG